MTNIEEETKGAAIHLDEMKMSGTQLSVSQGGSAGVTALLDLSEDAGISEQEKTTTAAAFLGCVTASAKADSR